MVRGRGLVRRICLVSNRRRRGTSEWQTTKLKTDRPGYASDFIPSDVEKGVFLGNPVLDNMMASMIALGTEVWSMRRRMKVLEAVLEEKGITNEMVEKYVPTAEQEAAWQKDRDRFIDLTYSPMLREGDLPISSTFTRKRRSNPERRVRTPERPGKAAVRPAAGATGLTWRPELPPRVHRPQREPGVALVPVPSGSTVRNHSTARPTALATLPRGFTSESPMLTAGLSWQSARCRHEHGGVEEIRRLRVPAQYGERRAMETSVVDRRQLLSLALAAAALPAASPAFARKAQRTPMSLRYPIRLSANENPWGPGPQARAAIVAATDEGCRYGMDFHGRLVEAIAAKEKVEKDRIVIGSGSGELLHMLALALLRSRAGGLRLAHVRPVDGVCGEGRQRDAEDPGGCGAAARPAGAGGGHDPEHLAALRLQSEQPDGHGDRRAAVAAFCGEMAQRTLVVVDEAYLDLVDDGATESMVDLARGGANLIVLRTFSKIHGLAGLRVGYGIAPPAVIQRLKRYQMATPNVLGIAAATASLGDADFLARTRASLIADRRRVTAACDELGLRYAPPQGNFVFFKPGMPIAAFGAKMKEQRIEVGRPFEPLLDWCRVSVGTTEETGVFIDALRAVVKA